MINKIRKFFIFVPAVLLLASCADIKFSEYRGQAVRQGSGGTVRKVLGIDFWDSGEPDRKYKVVGLISYTRNDSLMFGGDRDKDIAKAAKNYGGDAVIILSSGRRITGVNLNNGSFHGVKHARLYVLKYIEP